SPAALHHLRYRIDVERLVGEFAVFFPLSVAAAVAPLAWFMCHGLFGGQRTDDRRQIDHDLGVFARYLHPLSVLCPLSSVLCSQNFNPPSRAPSPPAFTRPPNTYPPRS